MTDDAYREPHEQPGYTGPRVLGHQAQWLFRYWQQYPKRAPHQGEREMERRRERMTAARANRRWSVYVVELSS